MSVLTACSGLTPVTPSGTTGLTAVVRFDAIELHAQAMPDGGMAALGISGSGLTFDPELIEVTSIDPAQGWTVLAQQIDNTTGEVRLAAVNPTGGLERGVAVRVRYEAAASVFDRAALDVALDGDQLTLGDANNDPINDVEVRSVVPPAEEVGEE